MGLFITALKHERISYKIAISNSVNGRFNKRCSTIFKSEEMPPDSRNDVINSLLALERIIFNFVNDCKSGVFAFKMVESNAFSFSPHPLETAGVGAAVWESF